MNIVCHINMYIYKCIYIYKSIKNKQTHIFGIYIYTYLVFPNPSCLNMFGQHVLFATTGAVQSTDLKWPRTPQNDSELPCWCLLFSIHGNEDTPPIWPMSVAAVDTEVPSPFLIHFLFHTTILLETHHVRSQNFSRIFQKIVCRYLLKTHLRLVEFEHGDGIFRPIYFT
jgi:hypothetical protein